MIKVLVPSTTGGVERREGQVDWTLQRPHPFSEYPIYPAGEAINLNYSVVIGRDRGPGELVRDTDEISIKNYGRHRVLANGHPISGGYELDWMDGGVRAFWFRGWPHLRISAVGVECLLTLVEDSRNGGEAIPIAKLVGVSGQEAIALMKAEVETDIRVLTPYMDGTSDFG